MRLELIEAPTEPPVTLAEAKTWIRQDDDFHDTMIMSLVAAATAHFDGRDGTLGRALKPQTWQALARCFPPCDGALTVPLPPLIEVTSVKYLDTAGAEQTLSSGNYRVIAGGAGGARIVPAIGASWPDTAIAIDAVRIEFRAGYEDEGSPPANTVPEPIRQAILMAVSDWYDHGSTVVGESVAMMPLSAGRLAAPFRVYQDY